LELYVAGKPPFPLPELPGAQGYEYTRSMWKITIVRNSEELMALEVFLADILPVMVGQHVEQSRQELRVSSLNDYKSLVRDDSGWKSCFV
jgi:hypothetical protein